MPAIASDLTGALSVCPTDVSYQVYRWKEQEFMDKISLDISLGGE